MTYDKNLKQKVETIAEAYFHRKSTFSEKDRERVELALIKMVQNYAISAVYKTSNPPNIEDIKQEVAIGILDAIRSYNPEKGKFLSWVIYHVKRYTNREKSNSWIKVPAYIKEAISKVDKFENAFFEDNNYYPTDKEICDSLFIESSLLDKVKYTRNLSRNDLSGNEYLRFGADAAPLVSDSIELKVDIDRALDTLGPQQKSVVVDYYFNRLDITEIAGKLGVSPQRVQQLLSKSNKILFKELSSYGFE